jgi:uncharacterized membrane protein (GlpM family)
MNQLLFRFAVGGIMVTLFALLADLLKPKSFAGLLGAAPAVALSTLGLTIFTDGKSYAALEARSMIAGALAFFMYACGCSYLMMKFSLPAIVATTSMLFVWLIFAVGAWLLVLR